MENDERRQGDQDDVCTMISRLRSDEGASYISELLGESSEQKRSSSF